MKDYRSKKNLVALFFLFMFLVSGTNSMANELVLTQEEEEYIDNRETIIAASIDGGAPLHYINSKGQITGIAINVLDKISEMTGLIFEYKLYESIDDVFKSNSHIIFGITPNYAPENMILSGSYLKSETILFINKERNPNELENQKYASIKGGNLPEEIKKENTIYYNSREETLNAVDNGQADYGYGNEYSIAFYTLQNAYKNIITIPKSKESREYAIGFPIEDEVLLSIINKSINSIDERQMNQLILEVASRVERKITFPMIMDLYGNIIIAVVAMVISILTLIIISNIRTKKELNLQNKKYELLSQIDRLTGLYNDVTTKQLIDEIIRNKDNDDIDAFILMDCDRFKEINDTFGHLEGDRALKNVSKALKNNFRETDIIGRIGGDEFCVYMKNTPSVDFVKSKFQEVITIIQEMDKDLNLTLSVGISFMKNEKNHNELFKEADHALYEAKKRGLGKVCIYDEKKFL